MSVLRSLPHKAVITSPWSDPSAWFNPDSKDFCIVNYGSFSVLYPLSEEGQAWAEEHLELRDNSFYWGSGIEGDQRYVETLVDSIINDGLTV